MLYSPPYELIYQISLYLYNALRTFSENHTEDEQREPREDGDNAVMSEQRNDNEEESGFEDELDDSNDGSSGEEGKFNRFLLFTI